MAVTRARMTIDELYRIHNKARVERWRSGAGGGASEAFITLGHLPDGRWFVEDTREHHVTVFAGADQHAVRSAAQTHATTLKNGAEWEPMIATYEPGAVPARAAVVPQWPRGHEPD